MTEQLYEERVAGVLLESEFAEHAKNNEVERLELEQQLALPEQSEQGAAAKLSDIHSWMRFIRESSTASDVDRALLDSLVERIEIGENKVVDSVKSQDVRIVYKFVELVYAVVPKILCKGLIAR